MAVCVCSAKEAAGLPVELDDCEDQRSDTSTEVASDPGSLDQEQDGVVGQCAALFLVDWDDTLFPTSWLSKQKLLSGKRVPSEAQQSQLLALAVAAAETLAAAASLGRVVIVTNAAEGWVQQSCTRFMPSLAPVLRRFAIVSARSTYEPQGVQCPTEWKCRAFESEVSDFADLLPDDLCLSVVALGDSVHEYKAALRAAQQLPGCSAKSLKFTEQPSCERLVEEHMLVAGSLQDIISFVGDLDVDIAM